MLPCLFKVFFNRERKTKEQAQDQQSLPCKSFILLSHHLSLLPLPAAATAARISLVSFVAIGPNVSKASEVLFHAYLPLPPSSGRGEEEYSRSRDSEMKHRGQALDTFYQGIQRCNISPNFFLA